MIITQEFFISEFPILEWSKTAINRISEPLIYLTYACSNWILKPSTTTACILSHYMCPTLQMAIPPWSNGIYEQMIREVVRTLKAMLQEERHDIREWLTWCQRSSGLFKRLIARDAQAHRTTSCSGGRR